MCEKKISLPDGGFAIICGRGKRPIICSVCHKRGSKLCDYPLRGAKAGKTCDRPLCDHCAVSGGKGVDYCPAHAKLLTPEGRLKL